MKVWHLFLGLVAGLGIPIQAAINTRLGAMFGGQPLMAAFVSFTVGALLLCAWCLCYLSIGKRCNRVYQTCKSVTGGNGLAVRWARFLSLRRFF